MIAHTTAFVTPVVEHWLEREIAQWVQPMKDRSDDPSHHEQNNLLELASRQIDSMRAIIAFDDPAKWISLARGIDTLYYSEWKPLRWCKHY